MGKQPTKSQTIVYVNGDPSENPIIYTNNIEMSISLFDVQIRLNHVVQRSGDEVKVVNHGTLAMSPQHALSLAVLLSRALKGYQEEHGKMPGSPSEQIKEIAE